MPAAPTTKPTVATFPSVRASVASTYEGSSQRFVVSHPPFALDQRSLARTAKNVPDSRTPRRFSAASTATAIAATVTSCSLKAGIAAEAYDEADAVVQGIQIDPRSVRVRADVARRLGYVTLPVSPRLVGEPRPGLRIAAVHVTPSTVTVGGETHAWQPGRVVVFDDTYEHEAWNRSSEPRVVLIFDIWNPHLTEAERAAVADIVDAIGGFRESVERL